MQEFQLKQYKLHGEALSLHYIMRIKRGCTWNIRLKVKVDMQFLQCHVQPLHHLFSKHISTRMLKIEYAFLGNALSKWSTREYSLSIYNSIRSRIQNANPKERISLRVGKDSIQVDLLEKSPLYFRLFFSLCFAQ